MCGVAVADLQFDRRGTEGAKKKKSEKEEDAQPKHKKAKSTDASSGAGVLENSASLPAPTPEVAQPDAAGLALEAISVRTAKASAATVADERTTHRQPVALPKPSTAVPSTPVSEVSQKWQEVTDAASGKAYWFNTSTGTTQWANPIELNTEVSMQWKTTVDASSGKTYYYNTSTGETKWAE